MIHLVTGATGALGAAVVRGLQREGKSVRVLVRDAARFRSMFPELAAQVVTGDILSPKDVQRAVEASMWSYTA